MKILYALLIAVLVSGCISTKKYGSFVKRCYSLNDTAVAINSNVSVSYQLHNISDPVVQVQKGDGYFIPALFYWGYKQTFNCTLNNDVPLRIFKYALQNYVDSFNMAGKLSGQRLEIDVHALPGKFTYQDKADIIYFVIWYIIIGNQNVSPWPIDNDLSVTYRLYSGTTLLKEKDIRLLNHDRPIVNNLNSTKRITKRYLQQYSENVYIMSRTCVDKIMKEL
jgi:hypothetical protein